MPTIQICQRAFGNEIPSFSVSTSISNGYIIIDLSSFTLLVFFLSHFFIFFLFRRSIFFDLCFAYLFIYCLFMFTYPAISSLYLITCLFVYWFTYLLVYSLIYFLSLFLCLSVSLFYWFICLFTYLSSCLFVCLFYSNLLLLRFIFQFRMIRNLILSFSSFKFQQINEQKQTTSTRFKHRELRDLLAWNCEM